MSEFSPVLPPSASIGTPSLNRGQSVEVTATFNDAAGGQRIDIDHPAGTKITAVANSAFTLNSRGMSGTLPSGTTSVTFTLTADQNAPIGTALGGQIAYGANRTKIADFTANITAGPVDPEPGDPSVTIDAFTVEQGKTVDVPVAFNKAISGEMRILLPDGLSPAGAAPAGFTWSPEENAFIGTVSGSNLTFTMHLRAAVDAPVGKDYVYVSGGGLNKRVSATITAAVGDPAVDVETVTVQQGETVDVPVKFNEAVSGSVEITVPAGLMPVGSAPAGFTWLPSINGFSGTVSNANRAFTMHLQAAADAPVGSFHGVVRGSGLDKWWFATITAAPVAPAVTIDSVTVRQGETVDAPVEFNKSVSGQVEIVVPNGLSPVGNAPAGFTWLPSMNGFSGTVTDANRAFTLHLQAASDAAIGTFDGVVRGSGLNQTWSATITAGVPIPDEPVVLTSPAIGAELKPGAPVFTGTGQAGATIQVYSAAQALLGETEVLSNGTWSLTWNTSLTPGRYSGGSVRQYVGAKPYTSVPYDFTVKATEVAPLVVTSPKVGDTIEETTPVFTGTAQPGARVEIRGGWGDLLGSVDSVASNGQWSITWNKTVVPGRYSGGTVKQFVNGVERGKFVYDFTVESAEVAPLVVTAPKVGATIEETTPVFTGTAQPGAKVEIRGASGSLLGSVESVASSGQWSITWNKTVVPGRYSGGTVKQFVNGVERGKFVYDFTIGNTNVAPLLVTSPKVGETTHETTPVFTGSAQPGAKVEIRGASGAILGSVESVASNGQWSITWNKTVLPARYSGGTVKQFVNGEERGKFIYDFTIVASQLVVNSPKIGETISGTRPVFTGTAIPEAEIQIRGAWGTDLGHTTANEHGEWTITWPSDYKPARYSGGTVTESVNGKVIGSFTYDFILTK
ncbi:hypothetical protein ITJ57_18125 [Plantibacter sp. VKM Ac-2880]|uniref:hypothetical protein n=1 Tax=Plantibacter sp. VKM Ac-2880 TaxID=2783827 RepID=UPI00188F616A|nr:hypothetical protein [Plantibacter sp. VKM Ac-2880]MBF4570688.1 hypothetical protein [Plantibacter sp. VKM Ac-2880]